MFSLIFASSLKTCWSLSLSKCICPVLFAAAIIQILVSLLMKGEAREGVSSSHWNSLQSLHGNSKLWRGFEEKGEQDRESYWKDFPEAGGIGMSDVRVNYDQCTWTSRPFNDMCLHRFSFLCCRFICCILHKQLQSLKTVENIKGLRRKSLESYIANNNLPGCTFLWNILLDVIFSFIFFACAICKILFQ